MAYVRNSSEPIRINHQNICGTTTCFFFSVAYHWTKNREEKVALASQPTAVQKVSQGTPKILPSCQMRSRNECIRKLSRSRAALKSTKFQASTSKFAARAFCLLDVGISLEPGCSVLCAFFTSSV